MVDKREYLQNLKMIDLKELAKLNNVIGISQHRKNKLVNLMVDCDLGKLEEKFKIPIEQVKTVNLSFYTFQLNLQNQRVGKKHTIKDYRYCRRNNNVFHFGNKNKIDLEKNAIVKK